MSKRMLRGCIRLAAALAAFFIITTGAAWAAPQGEGSDMDRVERANDIRTRWLGAAPAPFADSDPDLAAMRDRLFFGQIAGRGSLDEKQQALVALATLTANNTPAPVADATRAALRLGATPQEIHETIYQCAPYAGFPKTEAALARVNEVFREEGIALPLPSQATVSEKTRFADGLAVQKRIFGSAIDTMHANAPEGQRDIVVDFLSAYCFGDIYTRKTLDLKMRELVTYTVINTLGGCESQAKAHAKANIAVGNTKQNLVDALAVMLPFIGFPRTLNALAALNEAVPDSAEKR